VAGTRRALPLLLVLLASACGEDGGMPPGQAANTVVVDGQVANDHGSTTVSTSGERVPMEAGDFYFEPTVVTGPAGQPVVLAVSGSGALHTLTIAEGELDESIPPGQTVELELAFPESGSLVFACKYHDVQGMAGALVAT
jgi:plastocyanin